MNLVAECVTLESGPTSDEMKWSTCNWTNMTEGVARRVEMMSQSGRRLEDRELSAFGDQVRKEVQTERPL